MRFFWGNLIVILILTLTQSSIIGLQNPTYLTEDNLSNIRYFTQVDDVFNLTSAERKLFEENGFIVLNRMGTDDILDAYKYYWQKDLPILITTDTMLQVWHLLFDITLERMEQFILFPLLKNSTRKMFERVTNEWAADESDLPIKDIMIYLAVGAKLVDLNIPIPQELQEATNQIVTAIHNEITIFDAVSQFQSELTCRFIDDFSQYKPRGHYTHSETLKKYFRLFKWFSRIPFFIDSYAGQIYLSRTPLQMIKSASILVWIMKNTPITQNVKGSDVWQNTANFLDIVFGKTYSISLSEIDRICSNLDGDGNWHPNNLSDDDITEIQQLILSNDSFPFPKDPFIIDALARSTKSPKTFVFFGERLTLDTYAFNHLVYPYVGDFAKPRLFPNGLDFVTTCLQSNRAQNLLSDGYLEFADYLNMTIQMQRELQHWPIKDKQTVYWNLVESLSHLTPIMPLYNGSNILNVSSFMLTGPWRDEKLTTILGSWAQLKHDSILYIKLSLTIPVCSTPEGYVEPYPKFYSELGKLCELYQNSISQFSSLGFDLGDLYWNNPFQSFINSTSQLEIISLHELDGTPLSDAEKTFIQNTYCEKYGMCGIVDVNGWLPNILGKIDSKFTDPFSTPNSRSSLVADIHTDLNTRKVLEVASGLLEPLIAIVPGWDGEDIVTVGPVFSYYEFIMPMDKRLTDEDWRGIINYHLSNQLDPSYKFSDSPRGFWAAAYMVSTEMTTSQLYSDNDLFEAPEWFRTGRFTCAENPYKGIELAPYAIFNFTSYMDPLTSNERTSSAFNLTQSTIETNQDTNFANWTIIILACCISVLFKKVISVKRDKKLD
ncbi:MAG: DUF3160 domain-containing protein [Promethearchaeota archaeon]